MDKPIKLGTRVGFDYGDKRIGVATSDTESILVSPHSTILNDEKIEIKLKEIITSYDPIYIVVGNPKHLSGDLSEKSKSAISFAQLIKTFYDRPIYLVDERLSTVNSNSKLREIGISEREGKAIIDQIAFLLNDYRASSSNEKIQIIIESGDTGFDIANKLTESGVIKASKVFYKIALNDSRAKSIAPGVHEIDTRISSISALEQLLDAKRIIGIFGFSEGLRKVEILELLSKSDSVIGKPSGTVFPSKSYGTKELEGFLFPAQYSFEPGTTADQAISKMIERFNFAAKKSKLDQGITGYSPYQLLIIASMVQSEGDPEDFAKVSRVIFNRLEIGMPLQINATIDYALNLRGNIRLPYKRLEINSKFNTYKYRGLPPTPISNPGEEAMAATVNPVAGNWLYYVTVKPGDTRFTRSYEEFVGWANEFRKNEKAGLFE